jgi:hypothetical protein
MKAYGGVDVQIHVFLTSELVGGELSASHPGRFTPGENETSLFFSTREGSLISNYRSLRTLT